MAKRKTTEEFIAEAKEVWGDRWDYSRVDYINSYTPLIISCSTHGNFTQAGGDHLRGYVGCPKCNGRFVDTEEFIRRSKEVWGDRWDYSETLYVNNRTKITIICREHGRFSQTVPNHLLNKGVGCKKCRSKMKTNEAFIRDAASVWGDRWDYSITEYTGRSKPVSIQCRKHGTFTQIAGDHLEGKVGCYRCGGRRGTTEDFIAASTEVWGDRWDYSKCEFTGTQNKVTLSCRIHGEFTQIAATHLGGGNGCINCATSNVSKQETEVAEFLLSHGIVTAKKRITFYGRRYEIDLVSDTHKVGIEFNGIYWHSEVHKDKNYHKVKREAANHHGIRLIQIWSDDWEYNRSIVEEHLLRVFGKSTQHKISARDLVVQEISPSEAEDFLNTHHIQGHVRSSKYIGGYFNGSLVAAAAFRRHGSDYYLTRYATSAIVRGGHSKLVTFFERNYAYSRLITFADLTFSDGELYRSTGWMEDKILDPDYMYIVKGRRRHKFGYRINRFKNDPTLEYREGMAERELAKLNGLLRVYDAGKIRFIKPHP